MVAIDRLENTPHRVLPTPTAVTKQCGISIGVVQNDFEKVRAMLEDLYEHVYRGEDNACMD